MRSLASVQKISDIKTIEGADATHMTTSFKDVLLTGFIEIKEYIS